MNFSDLENYKEKISSVAYQLNKKIHKAMEIVSKENENLDNRIVIAGLHRSLKEIFTASNIVIIREMEDREKARAVIFNSLDEIKQEISENS